MPSRKTVLGQALAFLVVCFACIASSSARATDALTPVALTDVRVQGEIGRRIDATINNNLLVIDVEKDFLAAFRAKNVGEGYVGMGKLIDGAVKLAVYSKNEKAIALKKRLVDETIKTQEPDGYIGMLAASNRMIGLWDIHDMGYVVFALLSDYRYFGETRSLEAAKKLGDYMVSHWSRLPAGWDAKSGIVAHVSVTGVERAILTLYGETKNQVLLDFCLQQRALPDWDFPIVIGRRQGIEGHIYGYLTRCLAQLEMYRMQPDEKLLRSTKRAMHFMTAEDGACITGGAGQWEIWTDDQDGRGALGETCATAYQLRVYDSLLRMEGKSRHGDIMERTIYNALFGAQSPDGRRIRYYTALEGPREYFEPDNFCCPGNFRRIMAELPTMVYYRTNDSGLAVNLYTPSETSVMLNDDVSLKVRQETDYPTSGKVVICIDPSKPAKFPLQLRIPRWCGKAAVSVNGQFWDKPAVPGEFLAIDRQWNVGDRVVLEMAMPWRFVLGRKRQAGRVAVMRGPMVFCLNPSQNESLAKQDASDLGCMMLHPAMVKEVPGNDSVRPGGVACTVAAATAGYDMGTKANLTLRLTEFADPDGKCVYFRLPDLSEAVSDELFSGGCAPPAGM